MSRRALTKGIAWSVPTVVASVAAPAYAASCPPVSVTTTWSSSAYSRTSASAGTYTVADPDGSGPAVGMTIAVASTFGTNTNAGAQKTATNENLTAASGSFAGSISSPLRLHQSPRDNAQKSSTPLSANSQTVTFSFSRAVSNLRFTGGDIDGAAQDYVDGISVAGGTFTTTFADSTYLTNSGGVIQPATNKRDTPQDNASSSAGNVTFAFSTAVSTLTLRYYNLRQEYSTTVDGDQRVYISPFTFTYVPC